MKVISRRFKRHLLFSLVVLAFSPLVWAQQSALTPSVMGRAPVANPNITGTSVVGSTLTAVSGFIDADGDSESGSTYSWSGGGVSSSSQLLTVPIQAGGNTITLTVTPKTDVTITDPAVGVPRSAQVDISPSLGRFLTPSNIRRNWLDASQNCSAQGAGARLATRDELINVFLSATSAPDIPENDQMCTIHSWPIYLQCGGGTNNYWSSTSNGSGFHFLVHMRNGYTTATYADSGTALYACVR